MKLIERLGLAALHKFDPETSHGLSIAALKSGLAPLAGQVTSHVWQHRSLDWKCQIPSG